MPACEQLTSVQSDISPIDIASYLYLKSNVLHVVENVYIQQERIKEKIKSFHRGLFRLSDQD